MSDAEADRSEPVTITDDDRHALALFRRVVTEGPRLRAAILPELNDRLARHSLAVVQMRAAGRWRQGA